MTENTVLHLCKDVSQKPCTKHSKCFNDNSEQLLNHVLPNVLIFRIRDEQDV